MKADVTEILVVDDSTSFADCAVEIFNAMGYHAVALEDAESCLVTFGVVKPDLLIIDSNLPGMRGEKAVRDLRKKFRKLPIIGISAEDRQEAMVDAGANVFLQKPFEFPELLETVGRLLSQQEGERGTEV
ncbi:MAG: response regulator [Verrucomicrobiaceae bacterium]